MIADFFLNLTDYPVFRRMIWKPVYETMAKKIKAPDWEFMNYGYVPFSYETSLTLLHGDEINRYPLQLYHYLVSVLDVSGIEMLEVGSGRGGGANYIKNYLKPKKITGFYIKAGLTNVKERLVSFQKIQFISWRANWVRKQLGLWILEYKIAGANDIKNKMKVEVPVTRYGYIPAFI